MIDMAVRMNDKAHVPKVKPQRAQIFLNARKHPGITAVDQYKPVPPDERMDGHRRSADKGDIVGHHDGLHIALPLILHLHFLPAAFLRSHYTLPRNRWQAS